MAVASQIVGHLLSQIDGNGKAVTRIITVGRSNCRNNTYQAGVGIHQRAAGIAGVHSGIGLDKRLNRALHASSVLNYTHIAGFGTDYTRRHCRRKIERIAYSQHRLSHSRTVGVTHGDRLKPVRLNLQQRQIRRRVSTYQLGRQHPFIVQGHLYLFGILHNVVVSQNIALVADDNTRTVSTVLLALHTLVNNEAEKGLIQRGKAGLHGGYMHHIVNR